MTRFDSIQRRTMVVTPTAVYVFRKSKLSSYCVFTDMSAIIRSSLSNQVIFFLPQDKDLRFQGIDTDRLNDLFSMVKMFYYNKVHKAIQVYVIPEASLK